MGGGGGVHSSKMPTGSVLWLGLPHKCVCPLRALGTSLVDVQGRIRGKWGGGGVLLPKMPQSGPTSPPPPHNLHGICRTKLRPVHGAQLPG